MIKQDVQVKFNLNFVFINQLYKKKLVPLFFSSKFRVLIKYDYEVCISGSDYLMQCYSPFALQKSGMHNSEMM